MFTPHNLDLSFFTELSRVVLLAIATFVLIQKGRGRGLYLMALGLAWEIVTAPIVWIFWQQFHNASVWSFVEVSHFITELLFAGGLLLFAIDGRKAVEQTGSGNVGERRRP